MNGINDLEDDTPNHFGKVIWKADLQKMAPSIKSKSEIPHLVFSEHFNMGYLLYTDSANIFSVAEMENNQQSIKVETSGNFVPRKGRGFS